MTSMKLVLDTESICPVSLMLIGGVRVPAHKVNLQTLDNGTIMGYCPNHVCRWFIGDRAVAHAITSNSKILQRIEKPVKKEAKHGATS